MSRVNPKKVPKNPQRLRLLLQVAEQLFAKHGFKGVSIEMIAREAGMSKVTVYAYFHDKEDIFRQVAESACDRISLAIENAVGEKGTPQQKIIAALQAKDQMIFEILRSSPHANELLAARDLYVREYFERFSATNHQTITRLLKQIDSNDLLVPPGRLAKLLIEVSRGLTQGATSAQQLKRDISLVVGKLLN